jgi:soluble lytic murein transglycosylase-like protein
MKTAVFAALALACVSAPACAQQTPAEFFSTDPYRPGASLPAPGRSRSAVRPASARGAPAHFGFAAAAQRHGVPVRVALATIRQESGGRCNARGAAGELGPLQILPATARGLGYRGPVSALATCGAGLEWGMRHLALAYRKCGHVGPHNYGLGGGCRVTAYVRNVNRKMRA